MAKKQASQYAAIIINLSNIDFTNTNWGLQANKLNANFSELSRAISGIELVQSDWAETDPTKLSYILNKPNFEIDLFIIVEVLPDQGQVNKFYLVPSTTASEGDLFDEYIWVNHGTVIEPSWGWEYIGTKNIGEVDLTNYWNTTQLPESEVEKLKQLLLPNIQVATLSALNWVGEQAPYRYTLEGNFPNNCFVEVYPTELSEDYANEVGFYLRVVGTQATEDTPASITFKARNKPNQDIDIEYVILT